MEVELRRGGAGVAHLSCVRRPARGRPDLQLAGWYLLGKDEDDGVVVGEFRDAQSRGRRPDRENAGNVETGDRLLVFVDESGFYLLPGVVKTYAPEGRAPVLREKLTRDHLSVMAGMTPDGKLYTFKGLSGIMATVHPPEIFIKKALYPCKQR